MERGSAKAVISFLEENYADTLKKLDLKLENANEVLEGIRAVSYPPSFREFISHLGYDCTKGGVRPSDVLAFVLFSKHRLYEDHSLNMESNTLLGDTLTLKDHIHLGEYTRSEAKVVREKIVAYVKEDKPVFVDFNMTREINADFLQEAFGELYKDFKPSRVRKNVLYINLPHQLEELIRDIEKATYNYYHNEEKRSVMESVVRKGRSE